MVVNAQSDRKMALVFVTTAVALTLNNFLADGSLHLSENREFNRLAFWAVVMVVTYVLPPVLLIRFVLRERVRDYGLRVRGISAHVPAYLLLLAIALPVIVVASFAGSFQAKYPFLDIAPGEALGPYLYLWWLLYWAQFVALEFFFRGFMVQGLAPRLGYASIFAMVVPYTMLHFGKPMPEALAAIVGGVVLGTLSLKTRSIWLGASLHIAIALTMDVAALVHAGRVL
jgi:membrane protease YdiL (CAAX protease family)